MPNPELSAEHVELTSKLLTTKVYAKVTKRFKQDDRYVFLDHERDIKVIDFSQRDDEFAHIEHILGLRDDLCPVQISLRNLPEDLLLPIAKTMTQIPRPEGIEYCVGIPRAGTALAQVFSDEAKIPRLDLLLKNQDIRAVVPDLKAPRGYIGGKRTPIALIDDVSSRSGAKVQAFKACWGLGYDPVITLVLIDRGQGGPEEFSDKTKRPLKAALQLLSILEFGVQENLVSPEDFIRSYAYLSK